MPSEIRGNLKYVYTDDFTVIRPIILNVTPIFCPVCNFFMSGIDDINAFKSYKCCQDCMFAWAESRSEAWINENWRPKQAEINKDKLKRIESLKNLSFNH